ncbi:hypothetical protein [Nonomuraea sp. NPDC005692]|uniref:hypothetical protein n=1 Tax=Nonomuraea sp. NPDC005692 TaxID=3157168 RepID=UPI0033E641D5
MGKLPPEDSQENWPLLALPEDRDPCLGHLDLSYNGSDDFHAYKEVVKRHTGPDLSRVSRIPPVQGSPAPSDSQLRKLIKQLRSRLVAPIFSSSDEALPLVIVYLESRDDDAALDQVKKAIRELGGEIRDSTPIVRGSVWQAFVAVFKREARPELANGAGEYGAAAIKNKVYGETQASINKTNAEALQVMLNSIGDVENGLILLGNLLALRVDGIPYGIELTPAEVRILQARPDLQRRPADLHALLFTGGVANLPCEPHMAIEQASQGEAG